MILSKKSATFWDHALEQLVKKGDRLFAKDLLQLFDFARFLFDRRIPSDGETRERKCAASPGLANEIRQGIDDPGAPKP